MKLASISSKLLIVFILLIWVVTLTYDVLEYYSSLNIRLWDYIQEGMSLLNAFLIFLYFRQRSFYRETDVVKNLKGFILLLVALYSFVFLLRQIFSPSFSENTFPPVAQTFNSVLYANIASLAALLFLVPMLIIIRNLINYKYKKRTKSYAWLTLIFFLATTTITIIYQVPLDLKFSTTGLFTSGRTLANILFSITLSFLLILSTRNGWITYLNRRQKISFFFISIPVIWLVIYVFDFAFARSVPAHSLALGVFANTSWFFLTFYGLLAGFNLLLHLPTARVFDRKMKEINSLHNLSQAISVEMDTDKLLKMVATMGTDVLESADTWIEIFDEHFQNRRIFSSGGEQSNRSQRIHDLLSSGISGKVLAQKKTIVVNDIPENRDFSTILGKNSNLGSFAAIPLFSAKGHYYGILYASKEQSFGFDPDDVNLLEAYANQASIALENAQLLKNSLERERMEKELQIARDVQMRLLPQTMPVMNGLQLETLTITAYEVGGDYYDFYGTDDQQLGIVIGDVSGKGTSAAFYMAETKGVIQSLARSYDSPQKILMEANHILYATLKKKSFISVLAGYLDLRKKIFRFARAGHCPLFYYDASQKTGRFLQPNGLALGLDAGPLFNAHLKEVSLKIHSGDIFVFYTDGLSEARNESLEEFGTERLQKIVEQNATHSAGELKENLIDEILNFLQKQNLHDDLTLILIKIGNIEP